MMNFRKVGLLIIGISLLGASTPENSKKDCVVCHITWGGDFLQPSYNDAHSNLTIEGKSALVSDEIMCYSCHDGYVSDSRSYFLQNDYHSIDSVLSSKHVGELPLSNENKMYCGTCHTPHASQMTDKVNYSPFLRMNVNESQLCVSCHGDQNIQPLNHPIHVIKSNIPPELLNEHLKKDQVECLTCHSLHDETPTKFVQDEIRDTLCNQCHEPKFEIQFSDHDFYANDNHHYSSKGMCSSCHTPHGGNSEFLWSKTLKNPSDKNARCIECHETTEKPFTHIGHPVTGKQLSKSSIELDVNSGDSLACISCHDPHIWSNTPHQLTKENEEGNEITSFLKLPDDDLGTLCIQCHTDEQLINLSDHAIDRDGYFAMADHLKLSQGQCSMCHSTHDSEYQFSIDTTSKFTSATQLCKSCHTEGNHITIIGENSHPMGIELKTGNPLTDEAIFQPIMGCETCHNPHEWGGHISINDGTNLEGTPLTSFLKKPVSKDTELCVTCHSEQGSVLNTDHDLSQSHPEFTSNACFGCHEIHNAHQKEGLLNTEENPSMGRIDNHCLSCHKLDQFAHNKIPEFLSHPSDYLDSHLQLANGEKIDTEHIQCKTCHDPHNWSKDPSMNNEIFYKEEGNYLTSFLHSQSTDLNCQKCHGDDSLIKYLYFHDSKSRTTQK